LQNLESLYRETKGKFDDLEKQLVDVYISFLRKVARHYLTQGRRVFFKENHFVHWGEANFGWLIVEGKGEATEVFGESISEITFEPTIDREKLNAYVEIKADNLEDIKYVIR
jgi:hypothetical protein